MYNSLKLSKLKQLQFRVLEFFCHLRKWSTEKTNTLSRQRLLVVLIMQYHKILSYIIFLYEKLKNYSIQFFKECLFFVFVFRFLLLSNNIFHVMFYTYICYWNTFQYNYTIYITQITFHVVKQSHAPVTSKDICLLFIILFLCLFSFCLDFSFTSLRHFPTFLLIVFIEK